MCTLEAGEVHLRHNQVLDQNDLKQGWILACQAIADSPKVRATLFQTNGGEGFRAR